MVAARNGHEEVVKMLLAAGADATAQDMVSEGGIGFFGGGGDRFSVKGGGSGWVGAVEGGGPGGWGGACAVEVREASGGGSQRGGHRFGANLEILLPKPQPRNQREGG